jgi:hypothetical protein
MTRQEVASREDSMATRLYANFDNIDPTGNATRVYYDIYQEFGLWQPVETNKAIRERLMEPFGITRAQISSAEKWAMVLNDRRCRETLNELKEIAARHA